jgi:hypothetical protein
METRNMTVYEVVEKISDAYRVRLNRMDAVQLAQEWEKTFPTRPALRLSDSAFEVDYVDPWHLHPNYFELFSGYPETSVADQEYRDFADKLKHQMKEGVGITQLQSLAKDFGKLCHKWINLGGSDSEPLSKMSHIAYDLAVENEYGNPQKIAGYFRYC